MSDDERSGLKALLAAAGALFLLRIFAAAVSLPWAFDLVLGGIFIALPILGLFWGSRSVTKAALPLAFFIGGLILHIGGNLLVRGMGPVGWGSVAMDAVAQTGLYFWCFGLGALVAFIIKDKNLLLPIAVFLIGFDIFLVFTPNTFTARMVEKSPEVFESVAVKVPATAKPTPEKTGPQVQPLAYIGPADFIFLTTFFVALFRFNMRAKETMKFVIPVLAAYMLLVLSEIIMGLLPALVPIGLTVLLVNRREFSMNRDEKIGLGLVSVLAAGMAAYGIYARYSQSPELPAEPSQTVPDQDSPAPEGSPEPAAQD